MPRILKDIKYTRIVQNQIPKPSLKKKSESETHKGDILADTSADSLHREITILENKRIICRKKQKQIEIITKPRST